MPDLHTYCAVCHRRANGSIGHGHRKQLMLWACADKRCQQLLPKVYAMTQSQLDAYEIKALNEAADEAGSFLDGIEVYDIRQISGPQYLDFCKVIWETTAKSLKRQLENDEAPF